MANTYISLIFLYSKTLTADSCKIELVASSIVIASKLLVLGHDEVP